MNASHLQRLRFDFQLVNNSYKEIPVNLRESRNSHMDWRMTAAVDRQNGSIFTFKLCCKMSERME